MQVVAAYLLLLLCSNDVCKDFTHMSYACE